MRYTSSNEGSNAPHREKWKWQINIPIFLFFLFLSAIFWLLNSLNQEYSTAFGYRIIFTHLPKNKAITGEENARLKVVLKGRGYELMRYMMTEGQTTLQINLESTYYHRSDEPGQYYFLASGVKEAIQNQLGTDVQVISLQPDTLHFAMTGSVRRKIRIEPILDLQVEKQYLIKGKPVCNPDSIYVTGPSGIVDTLSCIKTRPQQVKHLNKTIEMNLQVDKNEQLTYEKELIPTVIPVEKYTEALIKVPIQAINLPPGLKLKTFPHEATLVCNVPLSDYDKLNPALFVVAVDYKDLDRKKGNKMDVIVLKSPEFAYSLKCMPESVEFIVE